MSALASSCAHRDKCSAADVSQPDPAKLKEAQTWIEAVLEERLFDGFGPALKNGALLCRLARTLVPESTGILKKPYVKGQSKFKEMENVTAFIQFCRELGVPESDNFTTVALYEQKNLRQVVTCIHSLGRVVQKQLPNYTGPTLGPKLATANSIGSMQHGKYENFVMDTKTHAYNEKPQFTSRDRKLSFEQESLPCDNYQLAMTAKEFGACICGFSRGAHGLVHAKKDSGGGGSNAFVLGKNTATTKSKLATPCNKFQLDMAGTTFGVCHCGHLRSDHGKTSVPTESQKGKANLGKREEQLREKRAKKALETKLAAAKAAPTQGWITKKGSFVPTWKRRYFVLKDGILAYMVDKDQKVKGQMMLEECLVTVNEDRQGFVIAVPGRKMHCKCDSRAAAGKWIRVLRKEKAPDNQEVGSYKIRRKKGEKNVPPPPPPKSPRVEYGEPSIEVLETKSNMKLYKSSSATGQVLKFEILHEYPRKVSFTIDITGSRNLKLKDGLAGKRTCIVMPRKRTTVALVTVAMPFETWSLNAQYTWEVEMAEGNW